MCFFYVGRDGVSGHSQPTAQIEDAERTRDLSVREAEGERGLSVRERLIGERVRLRLVSGREVYFSAGERSLLVCVRERFVGGKERDFWVGERDFSVKDRGLSARETYRREKRELSVAKVFDGTKG